MNLLLGGGGNATDSLPLDQKLAEWMGRGASLLYLSFALPDDHPLLSGCEDWIASIFSPLGIDRIVTWHAIDLLSGSHPRDLDAFDGVYIGGGNTFRLLDILQRTGLDRKFVAFAKSGKPISGGSAGAIVLGQDIGIAGSFGDANEVGLRDTSGLDLLRDMRGAAHLVLPHYVEAWKADAQHIANATRTPVIAIEESAGLVIANETWIPVGEGSVTFIPPATGV
ncbi:MAG: Type 1 glutamine amidotransferase-like domain-containing protein [Thermomicrobiales bacterium]